MQKELIKEKIDELVNQLVENLKQGLSHCIESITLFGSYTTGKMSLDRPNVNMLIFTKANVSANDYLKIGEIFYRTSKKYKDYFSVKIDSLPFRFGFPTRKGKMELILSPNVVSITKKNQKPPFGIPCNVLKGMKATRKVEFGSDPLKEIDLSYTKKDLIQWAFFDVGILFRNQLIRAPLTYDVQEHLDLLAHESLEIGKMTLYWGISVFLSEKDLERGRDIELINDKEKMLEFYQNLDKEFGESAKVILEARKFFQDHRIDKDKIFKLYNAAYLAVQKVFFRILSEMKQ